MKKLLFIFLNKKYYIWYTFVKFPWVNFNSMFVIVQGRLFKIEKKVCRHIGVL